MQELLLWNSNEDTSNIYVHGAADGKCDPLVLAALSLAIVPENLKIRMGK